MKSLTLLATWCCWFSLLWGTGDSTRFLLPHDTLILYPDAASGHLVFDHTLEGGQTLYGLSSHYGLPLDDFYYLNPRMRGGYSPGQTAKVALPSVVIKPVILVDSMAYYAPVFWTVGRGQSVYGIVHRYLHWPNDSLLHYNNPGLDPSNLKVGQRIFIGWLKTAGIPADLQPEVVDPYVRRNRAMAERWRSLSAGKSLKTQTGKAAWIREGDQNQFMVLHRSAAIGSLVELLDKRTGKVLYCRVIGRIPEQVYDPRVIVVVSPLLVRAFGVRDKHFFVQVKYY